MQPEEGMTFESRARSMRGGTRTLSPLTIGGMIIGAVAVILIIVTIVGLLRANPYGPETRIDNFTQYYDGVPRDRQSMVFAALHTTVAENMSEGAEVPSGGAMVRGETAEYEYDEATKIYYGSFVVDIESVQQSYWAQFVWSPVENNPYVGGYEVLVLCAPRNLRIYDGDVDCQDMMSGNVNWEHEYQWQYVFGGQSMRKIQGVIRELIISDDPLASYSAVIDEASLKKLNIGEDIAYQSEVAVDNDGRYLVTVRTDETNSQRYIAVYVNEMNSGEVKGFVLIDSRVSESEQVTLKVALKDWLITASGKASLEIEERVEKLAV